MVYERIFQESKHISLLVLMLILQDSLTLWSFIFHIHSFTSFVFFSFCETVAYMTEIFLPCSSIQDTNCNLNNLMEHSPLNYGCPTLWLTRAALCEEELS